MQCLSWLCCPVQRQVYSLNDSSELSSCVLSSSTDSSGHIHIIFKHSLCNDSFCTTALPYTATVTHSPFWTKAANFGVFRFFSWWAALLGALTLWSVLYGYFTRHFALGICFQTPESLKRSFTCLWVPFCSCLRPKPISPQPVILQAPNLHPGPGWALLSPLLAQRHGQCAGHRPPTPSRSPCDPSLRWPSPVHQQLWTVSVQTLCLCAASALPQLRAPPLPFPRDSSGIKAVLKEATFQLTALTRLS